MFLAKIPFKVSEITVLSLSDSVCVDVRHTFFRHANMGYLKNLRATDSETELLAMKDGFNSYHAKVGSIKSLSDVYLAKRWHIKNWFESELSEKNLR